MKDFYYHLQDIVSSNNYGLIDKVLDVGCGEGELLLQLSRCSRYVIGIDIYREGIMYAKKKAKSQAITNTLFLLSIAEKLPFADNQFDLIITTSVLEHVQDAEESIASMIRVLKPGGLLIISVPNYFWIYESHYGVPMFPMMPKFLMRVWLKLLKKENIKYIDTVNYITVPFLLNILRRAEVYYENYSLRLLQDYINQPKYYLNHWPYIQKLIIILQKVKILPLIHSLIAYINFYPSIIFVVKKP